MAEKATLSSFPNTSSRASSTAGAPSLTSTAKSKRLSLNIVSPSPTGGPRPLHLVIGSVVVGSPQNSPSHSPAPGTSQIFNSHIPSGSSNSGRNTPFGAIAFSLPSDNGNGSGAVKIDSPSSSSRAPLEARDTRAEGQERRLSRSTGSRRQSSISYISHSPSPSRTNFGKRNSVENIGYGYGLVRSPLSSSHHATSFSQYDGKGGVGLERNYSLGGRSSKPPSPAAGEKSSIAAPMEAKDRPPVTLAEKHSELLHFIAQKESKCLELRSQLAVHEAELLQLKRKWERIVNRGFERVLLPSNSNPTSANSPSLLATTSASCSPSSAFHKHSFSLGPSSSTSASNPSSSHFPPLAPTTATAVLPGGVDGVFEGIKEGVQGVSRLIAAGLGSITQVVPAEQVQTQSSSVEPLPLRLGGTSTTRGAVAGGGGKKRLSMIMTNGISKGNGSGHGQKESQSSSSTTSSAASSSLFSASSGTSATSALSSVNGPSTPGNMTKCTPSPTSGATPSRTSSEIEAESEFGDFEDRQSSRPDSHSPDQQHEQVLMVRDTGATPTMSPNPDFRHRQSKDRPALNSDFHHHFGNGGEEKEAFEWDDGWGESVVAPQLGERLGSGVLDGNTSATMSVSTMIGIRGGPKSPLAPMSAIPAGLASIATSAAPTTQQMSSWVGNVGKRWGEIRGSTTFTKNQKRASVLLSDVQQSLVSALASPPTASGTTRPSSASSRPFSSNASYYSVTPTTPASRSGKRSPPPSSSNMHLAFQLQPQSQRRMSTSLLDDSDDESFGESGADAGGDNTVRLAPVMVPDLNHGSIVGVVTRTPEKVETKVDDEDEWNW